jgi:hypothetical protein
VPSSIHFFIKTSLCKGVRAQPQLALRLCPTSMSFELH